MMGSPLPMMAKTAIAGAMSVIVAALLLLSPISVSDADSGSGAYDVTATLITSADDLPEELQKYYGENSVAVAFTLPSTNPFDSSSAEVVDFLITYYTSSAVLVEAHACAVDSQGNTILTFDEMKYTLFGGSTYLSDLMGGTTYSAYEAFGYTGGTAYAVITVDEAVDYTGEICLVTYTGNHLNEVVASSTVTYNGYVITATAGSNGSISPAGESEVGYKGSITYTITADDGYEIDTVLIDGSSVRMTGDTYTFSNVTADHTISVTFTETSGGGGDDDDGTDWTLIIVVVIVIIVIVAVAAVLLMRRS